MIASLMIGMLLACPILGLDACTTKTPSITIFPKIGEKLIWDLKSVFFAGENLEYTLSDLTQQTLKIVQPIENTGGNKAFQAVTEIVSAKPFLKAHQGIWLNSFVLLNQGTGVSISIAIGTEQDMVTAPNFERVIEISGNRNNELTCFDVEYSTTNDDFVVDCQTKQLDKDGKAYSRNVLYIANAAGEVKQIDESSESLFTTTARLLGGYTQESGVGKSRKYLFRASPAYGIVTSNNKISRDSLIEAFIINDEGIPQNTGYVLDGITMALLLGEDKDFEFTIVDWRIMANGLIYLLDAQHGIFVVSYQANGQWQLEEIIETPMGQAFAFDVNTLIKNDGKLVETMVVLGYDFFVYFEDRESKRLYDLSYQELNYPAYIHLTQEFVVVRNADLVYLYDIDSGSVELITSMNIVSSDFTLINPYGPDLIVLSKQQASRYTLSKGYLMYAGSAGVEEKKTILLKAKVGQQECVASITYQVLESNDFKLYGFEENPKPFPTTVTEDTQPFQLNTLASGPNIVYTQLLTEQLEGSSVDVQIKTRWELDVSKTLQWPTVGDVIYGDILVAQESTKFYILLQTKDKTGTIWMCDHPSIYDNLANCQKQGTFNAPNQLSSSTFQMWQNDDNTVMTMHQDTKFSIVISKLSDMTLKPIRTIKFDAGIPQNEIVSLLFLKDYFYLINLNNQILVYAVNDESTKSIGYADQFTFIPAGFAGKWKPSRLFGNRKLKNNFVFIVNEDNVILADFHQEFNFITKIDITPKVEISIAVGTNTFFVIEGKSDTVKGKITEYDYERINRIFKTKEVELYWYEIQSPINADFCSDTGFLYLRALCTKCDKTFIISFRPDTLQHDALFQAWDLSAKIPDQQQVLVSSQGSKQMFLYVNDGTKQSITAILDQPVMIVQPKVDQPTYSAKLNLKLQLSNYDFEGNNKIDYTQDVKIINTQTKIVIDQTKFTPAKNGGIVIESDAKSFSQKLGNDWYTGQISNFQIECPDCNDKITIKNRVHLSKNKLFGDYQIKDLLTHHTINFIQASNAILIANQDNTLKEAIINLDLPTNTYNCQQLQISPDGLYILSLCQDQGIYSLYATGCISVSECFPLGVKITLPTTSKIQLLTSDVIAILYTDPTNPNNYDGTIGIHKLVMGIDSWTLQEILTINKGIFAVDEFHPSDFQIIQQRTVTTTLDDVTTITSYFKLIISETTNGFYFHDFSYDNLEKFTPLSTDSLNVRNHLNSDEINQYALPSTQFWSFKIYGTPTYDDKTTLFKLSLIQLTSDVAHYAFDFTFKLDGESTRLETAPVSFLVNRYGKWAGFNKIAINNKWIAIPYYDNGQVLVGVYQLPTKQQNEVTILTMIGSMKFASATLPNPHDFALLLPTGDTQIELYVSTINAPLDAYALNDEPTLEFGEAKGLKDQDIKVKAVNDFNEQSVTTSLKIHINPGPGPGPGPDPDPTNESSNVWWIVLIIVGALVLLGIVGFFFYKKRKTVVDEERQALM